MIVIQHPSDLIALIGRQRAEGKSIGFVPTMGALHAGHLQLVGACVSRSDFSVCSIFINPTQFNDPKDFDRYPQTLQQDQDMLGHSRVNVLFIPSVKEVYPAGVRALESYDLGYLENILEGKFRPGHFQGVCQVMSRLLKLVKPDRLFMGQKDYQQCLVVARLLELMAIETELVTCPTAREKDGLAMSSRNIRLTATQRHTAPLIYQTLTAAASQVGKSPWRSIQEEAISSLSRYGFRLDYFELADAATLEPATLTDFRQQLVILTAAFLGEIRLIDNVITGHIRT